MFRLNFHARFINSFAWFSIGLLSKTEILLWSYTICFMIVMNLLLKFYSKQWLKIKFPLKHNFACSSARGNSSMQVPVSYPVAMLIKKKSQRTNDHFSCSELNLNAMHWDKPFFSVGVLFSIVEEIGERQTLKKNDKRRKQIFLEQKRERETEK